MVLISGVEQTKNTFTVADVTFVLLLLFFLPARESTLAAASVLLMSC